MVCLLSGEQESGGTEGKRAKEQFNLYYGFVKEQIGEITFSGVLDGQGEIRIQLNTETNKQTIYIDSSRADKAIQRA